MKNYLPVFVCCALFSGCFQSGNQMLASTIGAQAGILYNKGKMQNPTLAEVTNVKGEEIPLTNQAIILYGASGVVGAELQRADPKHYPSNAPGQNVWVKFADNKELNATYRIDMQEPYTFRVQDKVVVDYNGTHILSIRTIFDNPQNLDINKSKDVK